VHLPGFRECIEKYDSALPPWQVGRRSAWSQEALDLPFFELIVIEAQRGGCAAETFDRGAGNKRYPGRPVEREAVFYRMCSAEAGGEASIEAKAHFPRDRRLSLLIAWPHWKLPERTAEPFPPVSE
jgi:hypothetical protein